MRRILGTVAMAAVLAGCGATQWGAGPGPAQHATNTASASQSSKLSKATKAAKAAKAAALATATRERAYVDAMVASVGSTSAATDAAVGLSPAMLRCMAKGIVHTYGTDAFDAAGLSPTVLRAPDASLDALPDPTEAQIASLGASLQACDFGLPAATETLIGMHIDDRATTMCLADQLRVTPDARRFLVFAALARRINLASAHAMVGVVSKCVDLPSLVLRAGNVQVDPTTRACLLNELADSDAQLKDFLALTISGADPDTAEQSLGSLSVALNRCRPGAQTGFTVPSG